MPQVSLIQEQRDLFHRLQQIIEADRNARATVEAKRKEAEAHRKEEERVADDELRRATSSLNETLAGHHPDSCVKVSDEQTSREMRPSHPLQGI